MDTINYIKTDPDWLSLPSEVKEPLEQVFDSFSTQFEVLDDELQTVLSRMFLRFGLNLRTFVEISQKTGTSEMEKRQKYQSYLRGLTLFRDISEYDLICLARYMEEVRVPAGTDILLEGKPVDYVSFIVEGVVEILVEEEPVAVCIAGEAVGELSCLKQEYSATATVRAKTGCRLLQISSTHFLDIVNMLPQIWKMLFGQLRERFSQINKRYSEMLANSNQGVVKIDLLGRLTNEISNKGMDFLGIQKSENQPLASILFKNDHEAEEKWASHYRHLIILSVDKFEYTAEQMPRSLWFIHPVRGKRKYYLYYFPSYNDENNLVSVSVCIDDRTEVINAARALEEARNKAEQANVAKTAFLAKMSHEMRTPLNGIVGFAQLLRQKGCSQSDMANYSRLINIESKILLDTINSLLDLSKIASGKLEIDDDPFHFLKSIEEINSVMGMRARDKGLDYKSDIDPQIPEILQGDAVRLRQIILNLIGNSIKFTEQGGISLKGEMVEKFDSEIVLRFEVIDTGIGIPKSEQDGIFESFTQADSTITRRFGGSGLGTTIAKELTQLMGGAIGLESKVNQGSTFWFTVRFRVVSDQKILNEIATENKVAGGVHEGMRWRGKVLLAEDYKTNQLVFCEQLGKRGLDIQVAENGQEAVNAFTAGEFDLVFMDVHMPKMDGLEATRQIREFEKERSTKTPILALTAAVYAEDKKACTDAGMDDFLEKPLNQTQVISKLCKWLGPGYEIAPEASDKSAKGEGDIAIDTLPGLEIKKALITLGCGIDVYKNIAATFYKENIETENKIGEARSKNEWPLLERLAHSLKSTGANIGALRLSEAALALEKICRDGFVAKTGNKLVDNVTALLSEVMESLSSLSTPVKEKMREAPQVMADKELIMPTLDIMAKALDLADTLSISEALEALRPLVPFIFIENLENQIDEYDYEEALETVAEMKSSLVQDET